MKVVVFTLGCKVNEVESASIMAELEKLGMEVSDKLSYADAYVLNTCAVTKEAEKKSRQLVARVRKFNEQAPVYICGCASEKNGQQFEERGVKYVGGARDKQKLVEAVAADFNAACEYGSDALSFPKQLKTRAFIKIQDGCNNFCSYCIIPYLRGRQRSRTVDDILQEINATSSQEIVLTGINISSFGRERGEGLITLIDALKNVDKRIRLGSLECNIIDDKLLTSLKNLADFAPQFHLSLQSGSNAVLKAMNRHYTREEYLEKCNAIYKYFPDAAITTDIIVGFCGETEEDFADSLSIIDEAGFARVHAFAFSPREGTKAFTLKDLPAEVKSERLHRLLKAGKLAEQKYIARHISTEQRVIFEEFDGEYTSGYTAGYIKVYCLGNLCGQTLNVKLIQPFNDGALGEVIAAADKAADR